LHQGKGHKNNYPSTHFTYIFLFLGSFSPCFSLNILSCASCALGQLRVLGPARHVLTAVEGNVSLEGRGVDAKLLDQVLHFGLVVLLRLDHVEGELLDVRVVLV